MANLETKKTPRKGKQSKKFPQPPKSIFGNIFFYILTFFALYFLVMAFSGFTGDLEERPLSETISSIKEEKVQDIVIAGDNIEVLLKDGTQFVSKKESSVSFDEVLSNNNVDRSKVAGEIKVEQRLGLIDILG